MIEDLRPRGSFVKRFDTLPSMDGYEVIDRDGRPVAVRGTHQSANGVAFRLNEIASTHPQGLAKAIATLR